LTSLDKGYELVLWSLEVAKETKKHAVRFEYWNIMVSHKDGKFKMDFCVFKMLKLKTYMCAMQDKYT
jgi:hypothetical protein